MSVTVTPVRGCVAHLLAGPSPVEHAERAAIAACWQRELAKKPKMFDGRILLAETAEIRDGVAHFTFRECAFSTLVWLRETVHETPPLLNAFGAAVVVSSDGAALLGRMVPGTANAGRIYFPCGTPDPGDVFGARVDLDGSITRELTEETGLEAPLVVPTGRCVVVQDQEVVGFLRRFDTSLDAEALEAAARRHIARDPDPELDGFVLARSGADLTDAALPYVPACLPALLAH